MNKKTVIIIFVIYVVLHLLMMPTYEVDRGFENLEYQTSDAIVTVRLTGKHSENGSRLLNQAIKAQPYFLQASIDVSDGRYTSAAFESITLIDVNNNVEKLSAKSQGLKPFKKNYGLPYFVGYASDYDLRTAQGTLDLEYRNHLIKIKVKLCDSTSCKVIELEQPIVYRIKRKFYSNSFANMMGI